jgi:anti-anti-sigma factor
MGKPAGKEAAMSSNALNTTRGFRVERRQDGDCTVVACFGRLVSDNVPMLKDAMRDACEKKGRIVLDLKEVPMMDSSGLGAMVAVYVSARTRGCKLEIVNASNQVYDLFSMSNLLSLFEGVGRCGRLM